MTLIDIRKINKGKIKLSKDNQSNKRPIIPEGNNLAEIEKNYFFDGNIYKKFFVHYYIHFVEYNYYYYY